jgi:hypothetical protein
LKSGITGGDIGDEGGLDFTFSTYVNHKTKRVYPFFGLATCEGRFDGFHNRSIEWEDDREEVEPN